MIEYIQNIVENFNFNNVNTGASSSDKVINTLLSTETVDLGLPSGTLWFKYNLGVDPLHLDNAENWYGNFYAWGETIPNKSEGYSWETYKFGYPKILKYNEEDNLNILQPVDDASTVMYGSNVHIPSKKQFEELFSLKYKCIHKSIVKNGKRSYIKDLYGILFTGNNGNELFFPACGSYDDSGYEKDDGVKCRYWTNACEPKNMGYFCYMRGDFAYYLNINLSQKYNGFNIRPVIDKR